MKLNYFNLLFLAVLLFLLSLIFGCESFKDKGHDGIKPLEHYKDDDPYDASSSSTRLEWQKPQFVIESLGDISDKVIADIGAESGYFTFRLAKKAKKVIAIEIDPEMIELIELFKQNVDLSMQEVIDTRKALPNDPRLRNGEIDIALIINTIGYIEDKVDYLKRVRRGLNEDGLLLIVDFKANGVPQELIYSPDILVKLEDIYKDIENSGFHVVKVNEHALPYQYMIWAFK